MCKRVENGRWKWLKPHATVNDPFSKILESFWNAFMSHSLPRVVIAGTQSGTGKTSLSLALVASLRRRGLRIQTYKIGPDFLDPSYLTLASGRPCYNLDGWMTRKEYVLDLFHRTMEDADIAVIEGVMGLFDGSDPATSEGSTAEMARWLDAPVLLVVNVHGMARSLSAVVKGCVEFERDLPGRGQQNRHARRPLPSH